MIDYEEDEEARATMIDRVGTETAEALIEWYNCTMIGAADAIRLIDLFESGNFIFFECANAKCPNHPDLVLYGSPDNWDHFQGVCQSEYLGELCGDCATEYIYLKQFAND